MSVIPLLMRSSLNSSVVRLELRRGRLYTGTKDELRRGRLYTGTKDELFPVVSYISSVVINKKSTFRQSKSRQTDNQTDEEKEKISPLSDFRHGVAIS